MISRLWSSSLDFLDRAVATRSKTTRWSCDSCGVFLFLEIHIPVLGLVYRSDSHKLIFIPLFSAFKTIVMKSLEALVTLEEILFLNGYFFIPQVENILKLPLWKEKPCLPQAYGSWEARFSSWWLIFGAFSTLGIKKFPYPKPDPFGNPILLWNSGHVLVLCTKTSSLYLGETERT